MLMPRPLATGLLHPDAGASRREATAARVVLALSVNEHGFALLDILTLGAGPAEDDATLVLVEELAVVHDVQVLVLAGVADPSPVCRLAERARLSLWVLTVAG